MAKVSVSTPAFSATARVFTRPSCTFHSSSFRQGAARPSRPSKRRSVCGTWRRRSSTWPVRRPARHFPGYLWHGFGSSPGRWHRSSPHPLYRRSPRWSRRPAQARLLGCAQATLAAGSRQGRRLVVHPPGGRRPRGVVPSASEDPKEQRNLAGDPAAQTTLEQMRAALDRLTAGPLLPERFSH